MTDNSLLRFRKNQKYIVYDFETEGLNLRYSKPWQLGFIIAEGKKVKESYDLYIDFEDLNISDDARRLTGFSDTVYNKKKQDKQKVLDIFEKYLYDPEYYSIGHNVLGFDIYIHNILRKACGKKSDYSYINRMFDTDCLAKAFKMNLKKPDSNLTLWQSKLNNYRKKGMKTSQGFLLKEFGIEHDPKKLHNAIYDVKMTLEIFHQLIWKIEV